VVALALGLLAALAVVDARAEDDPVFTVDSVHVDWSAESAAKARDLALADGQAQAFQRLVARLVPRADRKAVPAPSGDGIAQLVQDFEVEREKTSPVRYIADLKVRFRRETVLSLLRTAGVRFALTQSKLLVVLPVYRRAGALSLWDEVNGWLHAWQGLPPSDTLVPLAVPEGDLADIADIGPEQALAGDEARIAAIARRYGAGGALLAYAVPGTRAGAAPLVEVTLSQFAGAARERTLVLTIAGEAGESEAALLKRAAAKVRDEVEENWKRDNLIRFDERRYLVVLAPLRGIDDWVRINRALEGIAFIEKSELMQLSRGEASLRLTFLGDEEQLALALAQRDLDLARGPLSWVLRVRPAAPAAGAPAGAADP